MRKQKWLVLLLCLLLCLPVLTADPAQAGETNQKTLSEIQSDIRQNKVGKYGMIPVYGRDIRDGVYEIGVDSSSPFFKIVHADLYVNKGKMAAKITIGSLSYAWVYPGTKKEAAEADQKDWIGYEEEGGQSIFTIPVGALDQETECAAYSRKRKIWYDRTLVFDASTLPEEALKIDLPDYELIEEAVLAYQGGDPEEENRETTSAEPAKAAEAAEPADIAMEDGEYSIEVNMTGGSGRASVSSPTHLIVRDGKAYARLLWSSVYYDYMIVNDVRYDNLAADGGNSTFEIPITVFDAPMPVIADTTAMGDPVEIAYTLTFYEESVGTKGQIPQEAAKKVLIIALIIIAAGGILNWFVKKKRK